MSFVVDSLVTWPGTPSPVQLLTLLLVWRHYKLVILLREADALATRSLSDFFDPKNIHCLKQLSSLCKFILQHVTRYSQPAKCVKAGLKSWDMVASVLLFTVFQCVTPTSHQMSVLRKCDLHRGVECRFVIHTGLYISIMLLLLLDVALLHLAEMWPI